MQIKEPFRWLQPALVSLVGSNGTQLVCEFVGAAPKTVRRWVANANPAKGENEIRLWHLLLAAGYEFPELEIPEFNFYLAQLHAYSIITFDEVAQLCGVKNEQTALQIMRGQPPMHPAVLLEDLKELYDEPLQAARANLQQTLSAADPLPVETMILPQLPTIPMKAVNEVLTFEMLVQVLGDLLSAALPLAELALDSWTPEQRARLRELVGDEAMFELSNNMNALCSERARANQGRR